MARILRLRSSFVLVFVGLALAFAGCGGSSAPSPHQASLLGSAVDGVAQAAMQQQGMPGMTVALSKNGRMLYPQGYGVSDLAARQRTQPGAIFEIGSVTKQFTAALIMNLQEQGQLHVDDSISVHLPEYNFPSASTLRMMLTHTSGLADFTNFPQLSPCNSSPAHSTRTPTLISSPWARSSKSSPASLTLRTSIITSSSRWA
jgi:CubicO group peptidase (beta-lactamase class C family)